jgi:hypothetical protein
MSTFNDSYKNYPSANYRYTLTFKTTWEQHTLVQEVASKTGKNIADTCRDLIELGLAHYNHRELNQEDWSRLQLFAEAKRVRDLQHLIQILAEIKTEISVDEFQKYCTTFGIDPTEVDNVPATSRKVTKRERCLSFLRVLFYDRPEGLPANRVLDIAELEGLGKNLTRKVAAEMGIRFQPTETKEGRIYLWIPP